MARTVRDANLETRAARSRLAVSGRPYWKAIDSGLHIGYRKNKTRRKGKTGSKWVVRCYLGDQRYVLETLDCNPDDVLDADGHAVLSFSQAQSRARELFINHRRRAAGLPEHRRGPYTVGDALRDYLDGIESTHKSVDDARHRASAIIAPKLGDVPVSKLTTLILQRWLDGLASTPPRARTKKGQPQAYRPGFDPTDPDHRRRRKASANRDLALLRAALNAAWRAGKIPTDDPWRRLRPFKDVDVARVRYLEVAEAKRLMNACEPDFRQLVQGALATGCRLGELRRLTVADFHADSGTVHIKISKSGKPRHVALSDEGIAFFRQLTAGRPGSELLFLKADGNAWGAGQQAARIRHACARARISPPVSFHVLRHTYCSLAIMAGAPLQVIAKNVGHADTRMLEAHYGHLADSYVKAQIRAAVPSFGFKPDTKIKRMR